jgi:hypothetical protein
MPLVITEGAALSEALDPCYVSLVFALHRILLIFTNNIAIDCHHRNIHGEDQVCASHQMLSFLVN